MYFETAFPIDYNDGKIITIGPPSSALPRFKQGHVTQCFEEKLHNAIHSA
jgi:hypothetical protein